MAGSHRAPDAPPHDIDAEQIVLGSAMQSAGALADVTEIITPAHFYRPGHQAIAAAIFALAARGDPHDPVAVGDELERRGELGKLGGKGRLYLAELIEAVPVAVQAGYHARIVARKAQSWGLQEFGNEAIQRARSGEDIDFGALRARLDKLEAGSTGPSSTWRPVDLRPVLDGTREVPVPAVGSRDDGVGLLYPGKIHALGAETEAGKTWLALTTAAGEIARGSHVVYVDFEDDEGGVAGRLMILGMSPDKIAEFFHYIRPEDPLGAGSGRRDLLGLVGDTQPALVVVDGVTEAMVLHGLDLKDNTDVGRFLELLPRPLARLGPATLMLDHVVKDRDARGRYDLGGVHKLNGIDGASFTLIRRKPFGIGMEGVSSLCIRKDRHGQLRRHGIPAGELYHFADLVLKSHDETFTEASLPAPVPRSSGHGAAWRPTVLMERISLFCESKPGLTKNALVIGVKGKTDHKKLALELLVQEGYIGAEKDGNSYHHRSLQPFREANDGQGEFDVTPDPEPDPI
jgi:DnaB-like helicase N terminal domain/AAA domain